MAFMGLFDWFRGAARSRAPFRMRVNDAFALKVPGKVVVVGIVADGEVRPGDRLVLRTAAAEAPVTVEALEANHKLLRAARRGDQVGIMLVGADKVQVGPGAVLASADARALDMGEAMEAFINTVCGRMGIAYGGYHTFNVGHLDGEGCPEIFFHVGEERKDFIQLRTGEVYRGTGVVYTALVGSRRTVIRDNKGHLVAEYSDLTKATVFFDQTGPP